MEELTNSTFSVVNVPSQTIRPTQQQNFTSSVQINTPSADFQASLDLDQSNTTSSSCGESQAEQAVVSDQVVSIPEHPMVTRLKNGISQPNQRYALQISASPKLPSCVSQAKQDPYWTQAMNDEVQALKKNRTWELVERRPDFNVLSCKWIYMYKLNKHGKISR